MKFEPRGRWMVPAALMVLGLPSIGSTAGGGGGWGTIKPYTMTVEALVGHAGTDVYVKVAAEPGYDVPTEAKKVQLKSLDTAGEVRWSKNFQTVPLIEGVGSFFFTDIPPHMPIEAQANVQTAQSQNNEVLRANGVALTRPDLTIDRVNAPSSAQARQLIEVEVVIRELNGDLGATFDVDILEGAAVLDTVTGATILPHGATSAVFALTFETTGTKTLTALIRNSNPAEYDLANNSATFDVTITGLEPGVYSLRYSSVNQEYSYHRRPWWGYEDYYYSGREQSSFFTVWTDQSLAWPLDLTARFYHDGVETISCELSEVYPTFSYSDGTYETTYYSTYLADSGKSIQIQSNFTFNVPGSGQTYFVVNQYAADYVYYSSWYDSRNRTGSTQSGIVRRGIFVEAYQSVQAYGELGSSDGRRIGGWTARHGIYSQWWNYHWDNSSSAGYPYYGDRRGTERYSQNSGVTTPERP